MSTGWPDQYGETGILTVGSSNLSSAITEACAKADMVILATENKNPITCPFVFHRKMSKPGETLFYEFKTGNDIPVHYAGGLKTKKRIWLN